MSTSNIDPEKIILEVGLSEGYLNDDLIFEKVFSKDLSTVIIDLALNILDKSRVELVNNTEMVLFYQDTDLDQFGEDNKIENTETNLYMTKRSFLEIMTKWFWKRDIKENIFQKPKHDYIMQYIYCSNQYDLYIKSDITDCLFSLYNQYLLFEMHSKNLEKDLISKKTTEGAFCYDIVESYLVYSKKI